MDVLAGEKSSLKTPKAETSQKGVKSTAATSGSTAAPAGSSGHKSGSIATTSATQGRVRECWECKSKEHMRNECPSN